jgi:hypothetical protein
VNASTQGPSREITAVGFEALQRFSEATQRVGEDIVDFLRKMKEGGESELGRNPNTDDLLPFFERYAASLIDAEYKQAILDAPSLPEARARIWTAIQKVVTDICRTRKEKDGLETQRPGDWQRTIKVAADAVDFCDWTTEYGTYSRKSLMRPKPQQLRALLLIQYAQPLVQEYTRRRATGLLSTPSTRPVSQDETASAFPVRAEWLKERLRDRDWSVAMLIKKGDGPDRKTIRKMMVGDRVTEATLVAVLKGLNNYRGNPPVPQLFLSDIPKK